MRQITNSLRPAAIFPALCAALLALLAGCQSAGGLAQDDAPQETDEFEGFDEFDEFEVEEIEEVFDPLSGYNRLMFKFNDKLYLWVWDPVARGYRWVLPEPARVALDRAYKNITTPIRFANCVFQLKVKKAGTELGRLVVNSTLGILGLFDPAEAWFGWQAPSPEDLGQTLGSYGVGIGFPVVLPFLGPSNVRDGFGFLGDSFLGTAVYDLTAWEGVAVYTGKEINYTSLHIGEYQSLKQDALDPYTLFRDAYQQNRQQKIEE